MGAMKRIVAIILAMTLMGFASQEAPIRGTVVESHSPAIGKDAALSESIGIESIGGVFTPLIEAGASVPVQTSQVFSTAADHQDQITVALYRGNAAMVKDNKKIGDFQIQNIPKAARGTPQIEMSFIVTTADIALAAKDLSSGKAMVIVEIKDETHPSVS